MNAQQAINSNIDMATMIVTGYLEDLTDEEMMHRPAPKANHIKWQLGHLLASDNQMVSGVCPGSLPELPEGFIDRYTKETAGEDQADKFHSKSEYLEIYNSQTEAIKQVLAGLSEEELDQPSPEAMQGYAPTVGAVFVLIGGHWIMHAGQWAVIRRQLNREPLF